MESISTGSQKNKHDEQREQMNVVIVGHVDHGKSTLVGRLLADTGSLPKGKLEAVQENCRKNAKPFEYAFLLDALKDEQSQGITIDTARSFFKSAQRDYIIIDAPGHIEFLKNMISGAARAEAAMLVIDAKEGIKENSKRHGYMMSFLGIKNINVCVNKMDLVNYDQKVFDEIQREYTEFLDEINIQPMYFIPMAAREGDNIIRGSNRMSWYKGPAVVEALDHFEKAAPTYAKELRFPIQDIYKFTEEGDERRIFSGRIESGTVHAGDEVIFFPSGKRSKVSSIESFNTLSKQFSFAGESSGICLETQVYIRPGEIMTKVAERHPHVSTKFKANLFWMGRQPLIKGKNYKLKLASQKVPVVLSEIIGVLDATELSSISNKRQVDRHDVAECVFETLKPIAFDTIHQMSGTGRFVIVDNFEISGGGIILSPVFDEETSLSKHIKAREHNWERSAITLPTRAQRQKHKSVLVILTGTKEESISSIRGALAKSLEEALFKSGKNVYFLGISQEVISQDGVGADQTLSKVQQIQKLGEIAHIMTDAGLILITSLGDVDEYELEMLKLLNRPNPALVINVGENTYSQKLVDLNLALPNGLSQNLQLILELINQQIEPDPEFNI
jgi:bifunctional enzyme CysN/CysC